jgi:hypothetical protein
MHTKKCWGAAKTAAVDQLLDVEDNFAVNEYEVEDKAAEMLDDGDVDCICPS